MKIVIATIVAVMSVLSGYAQNQISGKVTDDSGEPLVGATILEVGTKNGTITNEAGSFNLTMEDAGNQIQISFVGYESQVLKSPDGSITITLKENYELEEVIIQTVRADKEPISFSTLDRKQIEEVYHGEQPIFYLEDLTPSIFSYSESGTRLANYGNLRLRGISQERINMTLNGIPLNDMIDHGVFFSNFTDIGNSIESVQVQRGVGTSGNGVASYAGSINFESINLRNSEAGGSVELGLGSFNTKRFNASASTGVINDKWAAYGSFSRLYSDGYRRNTFTDSYSFFFSAAYFGEKDLIKVNAFDANAKNGLGYSAVLVTDLEDDPRTNYLNENDTDDFGQQLVQLQHTHTFSDELLLTSSLYYGGSGGDYFYTYPDSDSTLEQINYPLYNAHYGLMSNLFYTPSKALEISGGVHGYIFNRLNEESITPDFANPYYKETSDKKELSAFAKATYSFGDFSVYGDLQVRTMSLAIQPDYDFIGIASEGDIVNEWTFFNPKVGARYAVNPNLDLFASFGRTGREPTRLDIFGGAFALSAANYDLAKSDAFKPEFVNDFEAGARFSGSTFMVNANYFFMDFENEIAPYGEVVAFGVQRRTNIPNSYRTGIELETAYSPSPIITFSGNVTYMQSQIKELDDLGSGDTYTDVTPILSPEWVYAASVSYNPISDLQFSLRARGISDSYLEISNDSELVLPSYFVAGFRANYSVGILDLSFEINNLLDEPYYTNGSPVDVDYDGAIDGPGYTINAGRNYFLTTRINF